MTKTLNLLLAFFACAVVNAQTINISFPSFAGKNYAFYLYQDTQFDTIAKGKMNENGVLKIVLPAKYAAFRGVGMLDFGRSGALDIVINGEKEFFIFNTLVKEGNEAEFMYKNTPENQEVIDNAKQKREIAGKSTLLDYVFQAYKPFEQFYISAQTEKNNLANQYSQMQKNTAKSPLYAARLCEFFDYINFRGSKLEMSDSEIIKERKAFVRHSLDFGALYTSGQWEKITADWVWSLNENDSVLVADVRYVLSRIPDRETKLNLTNRLMPLFAKYGKDNLLHKIGVENLLMPVLGQLAPALALNGKKEHPKNALLFFYDSDCGNCQNELHKLLDKRQLLGENGIRIISIAADVDKNLFAQTAQKITWRDNYCDFKGFEGENFVNYGVVGTPTLVLLDKDGIVRGRYAKVSEFLKEQ
ncbi:hypothetical protein FACS1894180_7820 [Bacteroidia bacterium]|nr:hypothetical protein FACS1894180_7820 [Bacteroidia bacterium]